MTKIAYFRTSTRDQSIESQRHELWKAVGSKFDKEFSDIGISGAVHAAIRPGFQMLMDYVREGDCLYVYSLDRLGRDAIDIQSTVKTLMEGGVVVNVHGLGPVGSGAGLIVVAVLAQIAELERQRIRDRTAAGIEAAKTSLKNTGLTQHGKTSLGRPKASDHDAIMSWRSTSKASISATAEHFGVSCATVSRACRAKSIMD